MGTSTKAIHLGENHEQRATAFLQAACQLGLPVACWQLPQTRQRHFIADCSGKMQWLNPKVEELPMGFVMAPFQNEQGKAFYMQAHIHFQWDANRQSAHFQQALLPEYMGAIDAFTKKWESCIGQVPAGGEPVFFANGQDALVREDKAHFCDIVERAVQDIRKEQFQKVVLSRRRAVSMAAHTDPVGLFLRLCQMYPNAFISLVSGPDTGTWLGASPEVLVSVNAEGIFRTIALAGTQSSSNFEDLTEAAWRQKEIEEQALVSRYIINCFKKIRLREFEEIGPRTVQAGQLLHLRTDFLVDTKAVNFAELPSVMLELLHPTSAVCGMPKPIASEFIQQYEQYDRAMYSGFLGPVGMPNGSHLFVNLRCMQLQQGQAILYAGAGITQDSNPEKEWKETAMKMEVIGKLLS